MIMGFRARMWFNVVIDMTVIWGMMVIMSFYLQEWPKGSLHKSSFISPMRKQTPPIAWILSINAMS